MILKVIKNQKIGKDYFSLILEKPKSFYFYAGQYLDIELPIQDNLPAGGGKTRAFTISSSPTEDFLIITSKKGVTAFKKFMENIKAGDVIVSSHPAGTFTLDESSKAVFITGGIGITPFRSMIKYALDKNLSTSITLIYSASNFFPFKKELNSWQKQLPSLTIHYFDTSKEERLDRNNLLKTMHHTQSTIYYLAGSHSLVNNMEEILLNLGVDQVNIRYDRFDGY